MCGCFIARWRIWCAEMHRVDLIENPALWVAVLFAALLFGMPVLGPAFEWSFPGVTPPVFERGSFFALWLSHAGLVLAASGGATILGVALAIFVTRPAGRDFRALVSTLAAIGQTFPPAAVLALAVPALGFGPRPTIIALFLYGLLPIIENAIAGLEGVPAATREAARGMGLSSWQLLRDVDLPLAAPVILAGVRVSVTIAITPPGRACGLAHQRRRRRGPLLRVPKC